MHVQTHFEESRPPVLHDLIRAHPLATFIVRQDDEIVVDHVPLIVSTDIGDRGVLRGHVPRTNSIWETFDGKTKAVAVFQGPATYITPSWYPSKLQHGKVVPTWNYVVAHAHGCPRAIHDPDWLLSHLNELTDISGATRTEPCACRRDTGRMAGDEATVRGTPLGVWRPPTGAGRGGSLVMWRW